MAKQCCGRIATPKIPKMDGFCGSISMATPITIQEGPVATLMTPDGLRQDITTALSRFNCTEQHAGIKLALLVARALPRAFEANAQAVRALFNRQMPLLMIKDKLFTLVNRCGSCNGMGCPTCGQTGFR